MGGGGQSMGVSPEQLYTKKLTMTLNINTLKFSTLTFLLNMIMQGICAYIILIKEQLDPLHSS